MKMVAMLLVGALVLLTFPAKAYTIYHDLGGSVDDYLLKYEGLRHSGEQVRVDGPCISACTLLLGRLSPSQVCVTQRAVFGFHMASVRDENSAGAPLVPSRKGTVILMNLYPRSVQQMIRRRGGLTPQIMLVGAAQLPIHYQTCR